MIYAKSFWVYSASLDYTLIQNISLKKLLSFGYKFKILKRKNSFMKSSINQIYVQIF